MIFSFFKSSVCEVCGLKDIKDILDFPQENGKVLHKKFCRRHFFEAYKKAFFDYQGKIVVTFPMIREWNSAYGFYTLPEMKKYNWSDQDVKLIQDLLTSMPHGKVAYFGQLETERATKDGTTVPVLLTEVTYLSKEEAYNKMATALSSKSGNFTEAFTVPSYGEGGVFLSSLL